jgi:hypothetical protein
MSVTFDLKDLLTGKGAEDWEVLSGTTSLGPTVGAIPVTLAEEMSFLEDTTQATGVKIEGWLSARGVEVNMTLVGFDFATLGSKFADLYHDVTDSELHILGNVSIPLEHAIKVQTTINNQFSDSVEDDDTEGLGAAATDGTTKTFSFTLDELPAIWGTIVVNDDVETFADDGFGTLTGDVDGTGTYDPHTGAVSVTFNTAPAAIDTVDASWDYQVKKQFELRIPRAVMHFSGDVNHDPKGTAGLPIKIIALKDPSDSENRLAYYKLVTVT